MRHQSYVGPMRKDLANTWPIGAAGSAERWLTDAEHRSQPLLSRPAQPTISTAACSSTPDGKPPAGFRRSPEMAVRRRPGEWPRTGQVPFPQAMPGDAIDGDGAAGDHGRPCDAADPGAGLNILTDPVWSERVSPLLLRRAEARQSRRASPSTICRRSTSCWSATTTTTISISPRWSASTSARPAGRHAARQRHDHPPRRARMRKIRVIDWGERRDVGGRRRRPCRAGAITGRRAARATAAWRCGRASSIETPAGKIYFAGDTGFHGGRNYRAAGRKARRLPPRHPAHRRLRAALVHGGAAPEPGRGGARA